MMNQKREAEVWERVMAASAQSPCPPQPRREDCLSSAQVLELLEGELKDSCTYQVLAGRVRKDVRRCLLELAREERRHYRRLEAVYYLMTGQRPCPDRPKAPCVACTNEELRKRYRDEIEGAKRYHALADHAGSIACVFHCLGNDEERHAHTILDLLQRCL